MEGLFWGVLRGASCYPSSAAAESYSTLMLFYC